MFTPERRERTRTALVERARQDYRIRGAAVTGSLARGEEDRWSDVDLYFAVAPGARVAEVIEDWSEHVYREFGAVHHFDLRSAGAVYRAFLLDDQLEVDLGFVPAEAFGPLGRGPFEVLFGEAVARRTVEPPEDAHLAGLAMHHVLHARVCIERGRLWQAEYWISALRDHAVELAERRRGLDTSYAKGAHLLPAELTDELARSLVGTLEPEALRRALAAAARCFYLQMREQDGKLAEVMELSFRELAGPDAVAAVS
jgi:predicted nucleotidyltransferase